MLAYTTWVLLVNLAFHSHCFSKTRQNKGRTGRKGGRYPSHLVLIGNISNDFCWKKNTIKVVPVNF